MTDTVTERTLRLRVPNGFTADPRPFTAEQVDALAVDQPRRVKIVGPGGDWQDPRGRAVVTAAALGPDGHIALTVDAVVLPGTFADGDGPHAASIGYHTDESGGIELLCLWSIPVDSPKFDPPTDTGRTPRRGT